MFSWYTQDTGDRIIAEKPFRVVMTDNKGGKYVEECYEGYGVFGGKDYYELLAEMNGLPSDRNAGIDLAFSKSRIGVSEGVQYPSLSVSGEYFGGESPRIDPDQGFDIERDSEEDWPSYDYL